jgi:predicted nucleic acid-binding protein
MSDKYFLDSNIILYSVDSRDSKKQKKAIELVEIAINSGDGVISWQVVQECLNTVSGKFSQQFKPADRDLFLSDYLMPLCAVYPSFSLYRQSLALQKKTRYSFYDSLIIAGALEADCSQLYSEDMHHGHEIQGLKILNPFH